MEKVRKIVKKYYLRQIITYWLACWMFFGLPAQVAMASMNAGNIVPTSQTPGVDFLNPSGSDITTVIAPHQAIIEYSDFNVDALKTLHFDQVLATDAVLNRIVQESPSATNIYGNITALGRVFIVNPAGIVFYEGASVNVAQLVASGLGMSNQAFLDASDVTKNMVFDDLTRGSGDVVNLGTLDATGTGSLYLVGKNVYNNGSIVCPDGLVVMAAGDTVKLGQPGSAVVVDVATDFTFGTTNYVDNRGGDGIEAKDVVLAAGDIWSGALDVQTLRAEAKSNISITDDVIAFDDPSSDAVATIDIIAGGDVTVGDDVDIEAVAEGDGVYDAEASITITAGGNVTAINTVNDEDDTIIKAYAYNGLNNRADVKIDAEGDVELKSVDDNVRVLAIAGPEPEEEGEWLPAVLNEATVEIDATNLNVQSVNNDVEVVANASAADENIADVIITTTEDVKLEAGNQEAKIYAFAYEGFDNTANVDVDADDSVQVIINDYNKQLDWNYSAIGAEAWDGENNQAYTTITGGTVEVISNAYGGASIYANAYEGLDNTARVSVTTDGTGEGQGDIDVISYSNDGVGWAEIGAYADVAENSNSATATLNAASDVALEAYNGGEAYVEAIASNYVEDGESVPAVKNEADITIIAGSDIDVKAEYNEADAEIYAEASYGIDNTANVDVTSDNGDVDVYARETGYAGIESNAFDAGNNNTASLTIDADGYAKVHAESNSEAWIDTEALNAGNQNSSTTTVIAGNFVLVDSSQSSDGAGIGAYAGEDDESNTAKVIITAGTDVDVEADYGLAYIEAVAWDGFDNSAGVDITANDGRVKVDGTSGTARIYADAQYASNKNTATVNVTAKGKDIDESEIGHVIAISDDKGEAFIGSGALYAENMNSAATTINADEDVLVKSSIGESDPSYAGIRAVAQDSPTNTTNVKIDAGSDVEVIAGNGGEAEIQAESVNWLSIEEDGLDVSNVNNTAGIDIDADGHILVDAEGGGWYFYEFSTSDAEIEAKAHNFFEIEGETSEPVNVALNDLTNKATVDIDAAKVEVLSNNGAEAVILAEAANILDWDFDEDGPLPFTVNLTCDNINNFALVDITTLAVEDDEQNNGNVLVKADGGDYAGIRADAFNGILELAEPETADDLPLNMTNDADVTINTDGEVKVAGYNGEAAVTAFAALGRNNEATVDITADDDLKVEGYYGEGSIEAIADSGVDNTANIVVNVVGGDVKITDEGGIGDTAKIEAKAQYALNSNKADVTITATATTSEYEEDGRTYVDVDGGNVEVIAKDGGNAEITAYAADAHEPDMGDNGSSNTANVTVRTNSAEGTTWEQVDPPLYTLGDTTSDEPLEYEEITYTECGDVKVEVETGGKAAIKAVTMRANENDSDVLICAEGEVLASDKNSQYTTAKITSVAHYGNINNAYTGVRGAEGISVLADNGTASIASKAMFGLIEGPAQQNTAFTSVCTDGDVLVIGQNYGTAEILAKAIEGIGNTAETGVCADGDVLVAAGLGTMGGTAKIKSEAQAAYVYVAPTTEPTGGTTLVVTSAPQEPQEPTSATANTTVVSHNGGVGVIDEQYVRDPATASIEAEAYYSGENNAYVGVAAGADLSPKDLVEPVTNGDELSPIDELLEYILPGNVNVEGIGGTAKANILSYAHDGYINTAETVVCAPGEVIVYAVSDGGQPIAQIKSRAGWHDDGESLNEATTRIYASEVYVDVPGLYRGNAVWAYAYGNDDNPRVPGEFLMEYLGEPYTSDGGDYYEMTRHGEVVYGDGKKDNATLMIQDYSERENCPECLPCPDCDLGEPEEPPIGPPAPLGTAPIPGLQRRLFRQGGCPALMEWLANEIGVAVDIQVFLANAFVSSTDCQPCETAARLKRAATILADEDGSYMTAMNQVFNELAPAGAPFTPEVAASIVTAFAGRVNDGTQYATAIEYIDAFVQYIAILNSEMGSPIADSVAYVMEKYGSGVTGSDNANMAAFIATRLENGETFAQ